MKTLQQNQIINVQTTETIWFPPIPPAAALHQLIPALQAALLQLNQTIQQTAIDAQTQIQQLQAQIGYLLPLMAMPGVPQKIQQLRDRIQQLQQTIKPPIDFQSVLNQANALLTSPLSVDQKQAELSQLAQSVGLSLANIQQSQPVAKAMPPAVPVTVPAWAGCMALLQSGQIFQSQNNPWSSLLSIPPAPPPQKKHKRGFFHKLKKGFKKFGQGLRKGFAKGFAIVTTTVKRVFSTVLSSIVTPATAVFSQLPMIQSVVKFFGMSN